MDAMEYFLGIYGRVRRAGPGLSACTKQAFGMLADLPDEPYIFDLGCGPGVQTVDLLTLSKGRVLALDFLPFMLERTLENSRLKKMYAELSLVHHAFKDAVEKKL